MRAAEPTKRTAWLLLAALLAACAHASPQDKLDAAQPVVCTGSGDCELKWARAARWLDEHSAWKLRTETADVLETYGPDTRTAYSIRRFPLGNGRYELIVRATCENQGLGCTPPPETGAARLKRYIATGVESR
jgi:hypothetical protein